jgi:histidinol-phosphatase
MAVSYADMPSKELMAALEAARAAEAIIRSYYGTKVQVRTKQDRSPVTEADVRAEETIRATLRRHFPGYGFYGEETGRHAMQADSVWLVDPIDGTKAFVRENPFFSTQIALMRAGRLVLGVSNAPAYGELAWAEEGAGAWLNERRVAVSGVSGLAAAAVSAGNLKTLARGAAWGRYGALVAEVNYCRGYGDFAHYHMLARGALDVVIESDVNILDIAALTVIVREAGGSFTELASNGVLHATVLERLRGA